MKPHKHCELIKAWADGAEIQILTGMGEWAEAPYPAWSDSCTYRIKPESKPDFEGYLVQGVGCTWHEYRIKQCGDGALLPQIKLTFDGETGELKSAEVLK